MSTTNPEDTNNDLEQDETAELSFEFKNNNPKPGGHSEYTIETIQDIVNCVNSDNVDGFMKDFRVCLQSVFLMQAILNGQIAEGKAPEGAKIQMPSFRWIDDWKRKIKRTEGE